MSGKAHIVRKAWKVVIRHQDWSDRQSFAEEQAARDWANERIPKYPSRVDSVRLLRYDCEASKWVLAAIHIPGLSKEQHILSGYECYVERF